MEMIELELKGNLPKGKVWVNCKDKDGICFEDMPTLTMPPAPRLVKGQKAVLTMDDTNGASWEVQNAASVAAASSGISLTMLISGYMLWRKFFKKKTPQQHP